MLQLIPIIVFTACWYWSSSINAIASQQLFRHIRDLQLPPLEVHGDGAVHENGSTVSSSVISQAIWLSFFQLLGGAVISLFFLYIWRSKRSSSTSSSPTIQRSSSPGFIHGLIGQVTQKDIIVGSLHCIGCLFTNAGFGFGSASLVQVVKLLEPIETLLITALVHVFFVSSRARGKDSTSRISTTRQLLAEALPARKVVATLIIVSGTSMLLLQNSMKSTINFSSVMFALGSGACFATRNVVNKTSKSYNNNADGTEALGHNTRKELFQEAMHKGMTNFAQITLLSFVPVAIITLFTFLLGHHQLLTQTPSHNLVRAVLFHCLYNMASITVLSLTSAPVHSLLNVGKRIANVLAAAVAFSTPISSGGRVGMLFAAVGAILYNNTPVRPMVLLCKRSTPRVRKIVTAVLFVIGAMRGQDYFGLRKPHTTRRDGSVVRLTTNPSKNFVVWMYPFPPPSASSLDNVREGEEVLICPYRTACQGRGRGEISSMAELTKGSFFHPYVTEHVYHKLRHFSDFAHHIQAIAMLSLLRSEKGVCVKTLGGATAYCNPFLCQDYNPFAESQLVDMGESDLGGTNFPFYFLQEKHDQPLALAPDMNTEQFSTYGFHFNDGIHNVGAEYPRGRYNSGEDIQSMAGVSWFPFLTAVRNKNTALVNYTGYFIANMLAAGSNLKMPYAEDANERRDLMQKTELLSIFYGTEGHIQTNVKFLKEYTDGFYPFGCRSTLTCKFMKKAKIKSYYSACLTLTSNYEGSLLSGGKEQARSNALGIVNPTPANLTFELQSFWRQDLTDEIEKIRLQKTLILFVDCVDMSQVPDSVKTLSNVRYLSADIPENYPNDPRPLSERIKYCYRLLSQYKNYAKVVITSRIHVGLPAAAMGTPVIFVSKNGWLPGGHERSGRVAGLLDVFHRVDTHRGWSWTFGDLSGPMPLNPGSHYADRFRASFFHRLRRNTYYEDAARMYGIVPLKRMGEDLIDSNVHHKFQFLLEVDELSDWQSRRSIEKVFYFHPNAEVHIHVHTTAAQDITELKDDAFMIFIDSGYDVRLHKFTPELYLNRVKGVDVEQSSPNVALQIGSLLWNHGGVFLSKHTFVTGALTLDLNEGYTLNNDGSVAFMIGKHKSLLVLQSLLGSSKIESMHFWIQGDGKLWNSTVLGSDQTTTCMKEQTSERNKEGKGVAVTVDSKSLYDQTIRIDTDCYYLIEKNCIFTNELHWEF